jgi:hypothetical protein
MQTKNSSTPLTTKGPVNIVVFIVLLLTLGGAAVYFKNFPMTKAPATEPKLVETKESPVSSISKENTETSSWQTYKHAKYGYEIKYPPGMKVTEKPKFTFVFLVPLSGQKYDGIKIWSATQNTGVVPEPDFQASSFQEVEDYVDKEITQKQQYENVIKKVTTLNGYDAIYLSPKEGGRIEGDIFVFHAPHVLHIVYTYPYGPQKEESYKMTQKILSTLKFID